MILKNNFIKPDIHPTKHCVMCGKALYDNEEIADEMCVCNRCKNIL